LFCIIFGRDSKPHWTDEQQIDHDKCIQADGQTNTQKHRRMDEQTEKERERRRNAMCAREISDYRAYIIGVGRSVTDKIKLFDEM